MKRFAWMAVMVLALAGSGFGWDVRYRPLYPSLNDEITIEIRGAEQGATLHWGVNAVGAMWEQALPGSTGRPAPARRVSPPAPRWKDRTRRACCA
jgi:hypothetical protein